MTITQRAGISKQNLSVFSGPNTVRKFEQTIIYTKLP